MRERLFIAAFIADEKRDATAAAIKAGYSLKNVDRAADKLLHKQEVQDEIERRLNPTPNDQVTPEFVISGILHNIEVAKRAGSGAWQSQTILRGFELLGKRLGMWTERVEVDASDKMIAQLLAGRRRAAGLLEEEKKGEIIAGESDAILLVTEEESKKPN
jgi:hypothetical protein